MKATAVKSDEKRISTSIKLNKRNRDFAKDFFKKYNLTLSDGINIFLAKVVMDKKLPFELEIPNKETMKAIREAERGEVTYNDSVEDLMKELRS
jgi:DNA-damage-inducible protein J